MKATKRAKRRKSVPLPVDTHWFQDRLKERGISQRELGRILELDAAAIFHILRGTRRLQFQEAERMAKILDLGVTEVLEHAGVKIEGVSLASGRAGAARTIDVEGFLDAHLEARVGREGQEGLRGRKTVPCPFPEREIEVLRCQTIGGESEGLDGALVYFKRSKAKGVTPEAMGRLSLVELENGKLLLRSLRRGYTSARYALVTPSGKVQEEDVRVEAVHPVLWMKF